MHTRNIVSDKGTPYILPVMSEDEARDMMFGLGSYGWCVTCGEEVDGVEPDARKYMCGCCGKKSIYGYEELLMMNLLIIE